MLFSRVKKSSSPLLAIVTGMEHSGTTALSQLLVSNLENVNSGFECGILLSENGPKSFHKCLPYYDWICGNTSIGHWGLSPDQRAEICKSNSYEEFYTGLKTYSPIFEESQSLLIDKTPAYVYQLKSVIKKISAPIIIIDKDINMLFNSYKKRGIGINDFKTRYKKYKSSLSAVRVNPSVLTVSHKDLVENPKEVFDKCLVHIESALKTSTLPILRNFSAENWNWTMGPIREDYRYESEIEEAMTNLTAEEISELKVLKEQL